MNELDWCANLLFVASIWWFRTWLSWFASFKKLFCFCRCDEDYINDEKIKHHQKIYILMQHVMQCCQYT